MSSYKTTNRKWRLEQLRFLPSLKLFRFVLDGLDEQRQSRIHRPLRRRRRRRGLVVSVLLSLGGGGGGGEGVVSAAALVLAAAQLLGQQAVGGLGAAVAGVRRVQVEQVGGEERLEARILHVHLQTGSDALGRPAHTTP